MKSVKCIVVIAMLSLLSACGGGGGSDTPSASTSVNGVASKGIIKKGIVKVYPVNASGAKESTALAEGTTDDVGAYSLSIGSYSGALVVEVSGKYTDEATGKEYEVPASAPLHAALDNVTAGNSASLPVTPLTDLAYRQAGSLLTSTNIKVSNDLISSLMGVDIINTKPVAPNAAAFASASQDQKNYALILAAVSQMMATEGTTLESILTNLNGKVSTTEAATAINNALATYITNPNNLTGETTVPVALRVGKQLTLALSGANLSSVQALTATLTLPDGLPLSTDASGVLLPKAFKLIGSAAAASSTIYITRYIAASGTSPATLTISLVAPNGGLAAGDIISITFDKVGDSSIMAATTGNLSGIDFRDKDGAALSESNQPILSLR